MSDFAKCAKCGKWKSDGKCRNCDKAAEEEAQKAAVQKENELRKKMEADLSARKAAIQRGEELKYTGEKHDVAAEKTFTWQFDFGLRPTPDIHAVDWKSAEGVQRSTSGSEGVWFVATRTGSVVVCSKSTLGSDLFSTMLARRFGLNAPAMRCVRQQDPEGQALYSTLLTLDGQRPSGEQSVQLGLNKTYFQIMEYAKSVELASLTVDEAVKLFGPQGALSEAGTHLLCQMGEMIGFDTLINNSDRLPFVWQNQGNAANVLLGVDDKGKGKVVVIDSLVSCVNHRTFLSNFHSYLEIVRLATKHIFDKPDQEFPAVKQVRELIKSETGLSVETGVGYDIGLEGSKAIQRGIAAFMRKCETLPAGELERLKGELMSLGKDMPGLDRIDLDFLQSVLDVFKKRGNVDVKTYPIKK